MRQKQLKKIIWKILLNSIENDNDKIIKIDSSNETATTSTEENTTEEVTTKEAHQVKKIQKK